MSTRIVGKFQTEPADIIEIDMPLDSVPLHFDYQHGQLCLWAIFTKGAPKKTKRFRMAGTGHDIADGEANRHINTILLQGGALVFHFFEI